MSEEHKIALTVGILLLVSGTALATWMWPRRKEESGVEVKLDPDARVEPFQNGERELAGLLAEVSTGSSITLDPEIRTIDLEAEKLARETWAKILPPEQVEEAVRDSMIAAQMAAEATSVKIPFSRVLSAMVATYRLGKEAPRTKAKLLEELKKIDGAMEITQQRFAELGRALLVPVDNPAGTDFVTTVLDEVEKENEALKSVVRMMEVERYRAQVAVKRLLVTYARQLHGDWYEATARDCGLLLDAIGHIIEPEKVEMGDAVSEQARIVLKALQTEEEACREVWYQKSRVFEIQKAVRKLVNAHREVITEDEFHDVTVACCFLLEKGGQICAPVAPKRPNDEGFLRMPTAAEDEIVEEVVRLVNGVVVTRQETRMARCCFGSGLGSQHRCAKPAVWVATFEGKRTKLVWCHEHKVEPLVAIQGESHGVELIENKQAPDGTATRPYLNLNEGPVTPSCPHCEAIHMELSDGVSPAHYVCPACNGCLVDGVFHPVATKSPVQESCECALWVRMDLNPKYITKHHPNCLRYFDSLMDVWKITGEGVPTHYVGTKSQAEEIAKMEEGEMPLTITPEKMHREVFENLPDFKGF
ncbi:MAG TPA: hypothetical protein VGH19_06480 [Verrucomicrobiae bacterium]